MRPISYCGWLSTGAMALALAGCGQSQVAQDESDAAKRAAAKGVYDLAQGCYLLRAGGAYVTSAAGGFTTAGADASNAEHFLMQPTGLGRYLFYTSGKTILTGDGSAVSATAAPADGSDWTFAAPSPGLYEA